MTKSRSQKRAEKESQRRVMNRQVKHLVNVQRIALAKAKAKLESIKSKEPSQSVDNVVLIADCSGVGNCCFGRPLYAEPTDVFRILNNKWVQEKFAVKTTTDLYPSEAKAKSLLNYGIEKEMKFPFCRVNLVDFAEGKKVCPFYECHDGQDAFCILGDDRLTQCKADPVCRSGRIVGKRRFAAWEYFTIDAVCAWCKCASDTQKQVQVRNWMIEKNMEDRLVESDTFHAFIPWMKSVATDDFHYAVSASLLFDWHRIAGEVNQEASMSGPATPMAVYDFARAMLSAVIAMAPKKEKEKRDEVVEQSNLGSV